MSTNDKRFPQPGTGVMGFGCTFTLVVLVAAPICIGDSWHTWVVVLAVALVLGLAVARYGDTAMEKVVAWFTWW